MISGESGRPGQYDAADSIKIRQLLVGETSTGRAETADRHRGCTAKPCPAVDLLLSSNEFQLGRREFQELALLPRIQEAGRASPRCFLLLFVVLDVIFDVVVLVLVVVFVDFDVVIESSTRWFREASRREAAVRRQGWLPRPAGEARGQQQRS